MEEKEMQKADSQKERPEVEKAINAGKVKAISRRQRSHPNIARVTTGLLLLGLVVIIFIILSKASIINVGPNNAAAENASNLSQVQQPVVIEEPLLKKFSNSDYGVSLSYPKSFEIQTYLGKDIILIPPKIETSAERAQVKITKSPIAAGTTADRYMKGTQISLGLLQFKPLNMTLSDGTPAELIKVNIDRAENPKGVYLLVFVNKNEGYYVYYLAPRIEYDSYISDVEQIGNSISLIK